MCGGTWAHSSGKAANPGLSPRVRGNRKAIRQADWDIGSIPACAGEPRRQHAPAHQRRVYPRVCGGTSPGRGNTCSQRGLSPRVRGNLPFPQVGDAVVGSIPACAGEPRCRAVRPGRGRVYPRVCGGTHQIVTVDQSGGGLSPRVRGNPSLLGDISGRPRSIPACAGEPPWGWSAGWCCWVYPRVCGGTQTTTPNCLKPGGLSPRVRGNRRGPAGV